MTKEQIGLIIKESRLAAGLTQLQVATLLGRPQQTVASWEGGKSQPDANTLFELFAILGRSVDDAFGFKKDRKTSPISDKALKLAKDYDRLNELKQSQVGLYIAQISAVCDVPNAPSDINCDSRELNEWMQAMHSNNLLTEITEDFYKLDLLGKQKAAKDIRKLVQKSAVKKYSTKQK